MNTLSALRKKDGATTSQKMQTPISLVKRIVSSHYKFRHDIAFQVGLGFLIGGVFFGFLNFYQEGWIFGSEISLFTDFYANASTELISIAITVLIIDSLYQRRQEKQLKAQLIREMGSGDNGFALRAVAELKARKWLFDGSLQGADLWRAALVGANLEEASLEGVILWEANLEAADLEEANLAGANLMEVNLIGADLIEANLVRANLMEANLAEADLEGANLRGANLEGANLTAANLEAADLMGANLKDVNLEGAYFDAFTIWPDDFSYEQAGAINKDLSPLGA